MDFEALSSSAPAALFSAATLMAYLNLNKHLIVTVELHRYEEFTHLFSPGLSLSDTHSSLGRAKSESRSISSNSTSRPEGLFPAESNST